MITHTHDPSTQRLRLEVIKFEARATHNKILSQNNNNLGQVECHIPVSQFLRKLRQENHLSAGQDPIWDHRLYQWIRVPHSVL